MAENRMDLLAWLRKQLAEAEPDLLREGGAHVRREPHERQG